MMRRGRGLHMLGYDAEQLAEMAEEAEAEEQEAEEAGEASGWPAGGWGGGEAASPGEQEAAQPPEPPPGGGGGGGGDGSSAQAPSDQQLQQAAAAADQAFAMLSSSAPNVGPLTMGLSPVGDAIRKGRAAVELGQRAVRAGKKALGQRAISAGQRALAAAQKRSARPVRPPRVTWHPSPAARRQGMAIARPMRQPALRGLHVLGSRPLALGAWFSGSDQAHAGIRAVRALQALYADTVKAHPAAAKYEAQVTEIVQGADKWDKALVFYQNDEAVELGRRAEALSLQLTTEFGGAPLVHDPLLDRGVIETAQDAAKQGASTLQKIAGFELPWWAWALLAVAGLGAVAAFAAPPILAAFRRRRVAA